jgi:hydroxypyruvate isomerase
MKRREFFQQGAIVSVASATSCWLGETVQAQSPPGGASDRKMRQSVMGWCFQPMKAIDLAKAAKEIGLVAVEGVPVESYAEIRKLGMQISLVSSHGFQRGPLDPANHDFVEAKLKEAIDLAVQVESPSVITFTGMSKSGISDKAARENCLSCWRRIVPYAEARGINLVLEHLNSKDNSHPMKGHPGYWGDDLGLCVELVEAIDSPNFRLLFDIYHVQIMHGDLIRNIRRYAPLVGHYHTAGNPGRGELDDKQEINYSAVVRAIRDTGYRGFLAQEFLPTWSDPIASLKHAFDVCDV